MSPARGGRSTCGPARERLLEADASALRGEGPTELARHLRECARCRKAAAAILAAQTELGRALETIGPSVGAPGAVSLAERGRREGGRSRWARRAFLPLAAAAAAAGLLLLGPERPAVRSPPGTGATGAPDATSPAVAGGEGPGTGGGATRPGDVEPPARFALDVPRDGRAVVFATRDPRITVVWLY